MREHKIDPKRLKDLGTYELVTEEVVEELKSDGYILKHKKSGARIVILSNDDDNKVFSIGFRTPPVNSTGVPHIVEHTVLCGSKEFPSKDPFVELVKGSLNTFLNAMTYPDKTVYPVASCNDKDFQNLIHVYMDAVFYPNIYKNENIFKQEGWHYELESKEADLKLNGVVYNEMKGAFSSPEQQLYRLLQNSLFPDNTYGVVSGGAPEDIPELSYEEFLDFHKKYYHPSNSYIYLYGDSDIVEKLEWMDKEYLSQFEYAPVDSTIPMQKAFDKTREVVDYYSVAENESLASKTYLSYNTAIATSLDRELYLVFQVLEFALLASPGAPLKQALIDAGIGKDILSSYDNGMLQPIFSIIAKNAEEEKKEEFVAVIRNTLKDIIKSGVDEKSLKAAINYYEFKYREADFGNFPKGLMYGLQILDSWLYADDKPFIHIRANDTFEFLKAKIGTGYYEDLLQKYLLDNTHNSLVIVKPKMGLTKEKEDLVKEELARYKETLSDEEIKQLIEATKDLEKFQETPSTKEELEKIPLLSREDIDKESTPIYNIEKEVDKVKTLHHDVFTNGIAYLKLLFDVKNVPNELVSYLGLLTSVLGYMNTSKHSYLELSNEVNIHTGGIKTDINVYGKKGTTDIFEGKFEIIAKVLYDEMGEAFSLIDETVFDTILEDEKRLLEIISEVKSRLQMRMNSSGHSTAVNRAMSYFSKAMYFNELTSGVSYYQFIEELEGNFSEKKQEIIKNLKTVIECVFRKENLFISCTADEEGYNKMTNYAPSFIQKLYTGSIDTKMLPFAPKKLNEGLKTSSKVQYVARTGNFITAGYEYTGALKVLKLILSYDYLWINIRVKGGAYGCMSGFSLEGNGYFTSYRDPNLRETNEVYEKLYDYIKNFTVDERDMTKYIIGTISSVDTPLNPAAKGARSLTAYLSGMTMEDIQKDRDQILSATEEDIRNLAELVKSILHDNNICVIGNETKIEENKDLFYNTYELIKD
ncbi:insulinase family protein [Anaeromicropila herbilytica]|uniref:Peptidase M16 n=1 Tax=Anaeromicropila herbilytica TaxID=2785025 RepID=A0A7R7IEP1_9FIRM|nr:insulinase family protein [Anaeromicropila herbilytica]BCN32314.1 peptidase M16 [Anaeromicropila herbilytica]